MSSIGKELTNSSIFCSSKHHSFEDRLVVYQVSRALPGTAEITNVNLLHCELDLALFDRLNDLDFKVVPVIKRFGPQELKEAEQLFHIILETACQHNIGQTGCLWRSLVSGFCRYQDRRGQHTVRKQFYSQYTTHPVRHHRSLASKATAAFAAFVLLFLMF